MAEVEEAPPVSRELLRARDPAAMASTVPVVTTLVLFPRTSETAAVDSLRRSSAGA
jgi:hypothetical protein